MTLLAEELFMAWPAILAAFSRAAVALLHISRLPPFNRLMPRPFSIRCGSFPCSSSARYRCFLFLYINISAAGLQGEQAASSTNAASIFCLN